MFASSCPISNPKVPNLGYLRPPSTSNWASNRSWTFFVKKLVEIRQKWSKFEGVLGIKVQYNNLWGSRVPVQNLLPSWPILYIACEVPPEGPVHQSSSWALLSLHIYSFIYTLYTYCDVLVNYEVRFWTQWLWIKTRLLSYQSISKRPVYLTEFFKRI